MTDSPTPQPTHDPKPGRSPNFSGCFVAIGIAFVIACLPPLVFLIEYKGNVWFAALAFITTILGIVLLAVGALIDMHLDELLLFMEKNREQSKTDTDATNAHLKNITDALVQIRDIEYTIMKRETGTRMDNK